MFFSSAEMQPSNLELLLNRLEAAAAPPSGEPPAQPSASSEFEDEGPPTLTDFLDEDDLLPECRSDNTRLIEFLCQEDQIMELVKMCTSMPTSDVAEDVATASAAVAAEVNGTLPPRVSAVSEAAAKRRYKYPYVASEVLSADISRLYDMMVNSEAIMDELLGSVEATPQGELDGFLAGHINKVCVALLSARNEQVLAHMSRRPGFVKALLRHVAVSAVADLLVHLLDAPNRDSQRMTYGAPEEIAPPFPAALDLLARADVLRGLAVSAVQHALPTTANQQLLASVAELAGTTPPTPSSQPPAGLPNGSGPSADSGTPANDEDGATANGEAHEDHGASEDTLSSGSPPNEAVDVKSTDHTSSRAAGQAEGDAVPVEAPDSTDVAPPALRAMTVQASEAAAEVAEETPCSRRLREEALGNAAVAFLGLSHRVLRLPPSDVPDELSPYASPSVVSLLVDAGLRASNGPGSAPTLLLQALSVAADLVAAPRAVMQAAEAARENAVGGQGLGDDGWGSQASFGEPNQDFSALCGFSREEDAVTPPDEAAGTKDGDAEPAAEGAADSAAGEPSSGIAADLNIDASMPGAPEGAAMDIAGDELSSPTSNPDPAVESDASKQASALTRALEMELSGRFGPLASLLVPPGQAAEETPEAKQQRELQSAPLTSCQDQMPLGAARLKVAEFFAACLRSAGPQALDVLSSCRVPQTLLALFTRHEWSSMLHGVVSHAVIAAADAATQHREYALRVWLDADIIGWLVRAWTRASAAPPVEENGSSVSTQDGSPESVDSTGSPLPDEALTPGGSPGPRRRQRRDRDMNGNVKFRPGYMGHLIQMSSALRTFLDRSTEEQAELAGFTPENREQFSRFCADSLDDAVALEGRVLGGERPPGGVGSEGEEAFEASKMFDLSGVELQSGQEVSDDLDNSDVVARFARLLLAKDPGLSSGGLEQEDGEASGAGGGGGEAEGLETGKGGDESSADQAGSLRQAYAEDENEGEDEDGSYAAFKRDAIQSTADQVHDAAEADSSASLLRGSNGDGAFPPAFRAESHEELTQQLNQIVAAARPDSAGGSFVDAKDATTPSVPVVDAGADAHSAVTPVGSDPDAADVVAAQSLDRPGTPTPVDGALAAPGGGKSAPAPTAGPGAVSAASP